MNKKTKKWFVVLTIITILIIFILRLYRNSTQIPTSQDLNSIVLIDVVDNQGVKKITICEKSDVNMFLDILKDSEKTDKDSTSDVPDKKEFTIIAFEHLKGGYSLNSIYKDNHGMYFEQPYHGIFKLESSEVQTVDKIRTKGHEKNILIPIKDILKENF